MRIGTLEVNAGVSEAKQGKARQGKANLHLRFLACQARECPISAQ